MNIFQNPLKKSPCKIVTLRKQAFSNSDAQTDY